MDAADIQFWVAVISTGGVALIAVYNGWLNSKRSREERTTPAYADLLDQLKRGDAKIKDVEAKVEQYSRDREEMMQTITELKADLTTERAAREEIRDDAAQFIDAIGRHVLGQATMPVIPRAFADRLDPEVWRQVPEDQRRFRMPREAGGYDGRQDDQ